MILSVSMFATGSGAATPVSCVNGSISVQLPPAGVAGKTANPGVAGKTAKPGVADETANIGEMASDGGGGGHGGGEEVRAPAGSLAALEVAVAGAGAALAGRELVGVHAEAHG